MSWHIDTELHSWTQHFEKKKKFVIRCIRCEYVYLIYVKLDNFNKHLEEKHKNVRDYEMDNRQVDHWNYYKLTKENTTQCIICGSTDLRDNLIRHAQNHIKGRRSIKGINKENHWSLKYLEEIEGKDFSGNCNLCEQNITLEIDADKITQHLKKKHNITIEIPKHYIENVESWKYQVQQNEWIKKHFTEHQKYFLTNCNHCNANIPYVSNESFKAHMLQKHVKIQEMETRQDKRKGENWKGIRCCDAVKLSKGSKLKKIKSFVCLVCNALLESETSRINHQHSMDELQNYKMPWTLKYIVQEENFASCVICGDDIKFSFEQNHLRNHILKCKNLSEDEKNEIKRKWKQKGEEYDQAGPSTSHAS